MNTPSRLGLLILAATSPLGACATTREPAPADFDEARQTLRAADADADTRRVLPETLERSRRTLDEGEQLLRLSAAQRDHASQQYYLQLAILRADEAQQLARQARELGMRVAAWDKHIEQYAEERKSDQLLALAAGQLSGTCAAQVDAGGALRNLDFTAPVAFFGAGTDELRDDDMPGIASLAELLQAEPALKVRLVGHADGTGTSRRNQELALRRAKEVADALVETGVARDRIAFVSVGASEAADSAAPPDERQLDRRVEAYVSADGGAVEEPGGFAH